MEVLLGTREYDNSEVRIDSNARRKHLAILGKSGTGKTTLLRNMIMADLHAGSGVTVLTSGTSSSWATMERASHPLLSSVFPRVQSIMRAVIAVLLLTSGLANAQPVSTRNAGPPVAPAVASPGLPFVRENYSKYAFRIPMRDGVTLFTSVYVPKGVLGAGTTYPIMLPRPPDSVRP